VLICHFNQITKVVRIIVPETEFAIQKHTCAFVVLTGEVSTVLKHAPQNNWGALTSPTRTVQTSRTTPPRTPLLSLIGFACAIMDIILPLVEIVSRLTIVRLETIVIKMQTVQQILLLTTARAIGVTLETGPRAKWWIIVHWAQAIVVYTPRVKVCHQGTSVFANILMKETDSRALYPLTHPLLPLLLPHSNPIYKSPNQ